MSGSPTFVAAGWGEVFGLGAALAWAITSLIFVRVRAHATAINFYKNSFSCVFLLLTVIVFGIARGSFLRDSPALVADASTWAWLAASALFGLVIGDNSYFRSLQILGPRRCLLMTTLTPPMSALFAGLFLGETLGLVTWVGMMVTLLGIAWVIRERTPSAETPDLYPGTVTAGIFHATVGTLGQALGAVCSKKAMTLGTEPLDATLVRMALAVLFSLVIAGCRREIGSWFKGMRAPELLRRVVPASFLGTYLGVWLCLLAYDLTEVGIATTMQSTSPIFVIPLVMIFLRQKVSARSLLGAAVAVGGIALMFR